MSNYNEQQSDEGDKDDQSRSGLSNINLQLRYIRDDIKEIKENVKSDKEKYITKEEFAPVKSIAYGVVGLILTGVVGALMVLILKGGK